MLLQWLGQALGEAAVVHWKEVTISMQHATRCNTEGSSDGGLETRRGERQAALAVVGL